MAASSGLPAGSNTPHKKINTSVKRARDNSTLDDPQPDRKKTRVSRKECIICMNDVASNQYPKSPHAGSEQHGSDVCFKCYDQHIDAQIDGKGSDLVSCVQCSQTLTEPEVRKLAQHVKTYQK